MNREAPNSWAKNARSAQDRLEALVKRDYERCRPHDRFEDLKRRARYEKDSKGLLKHWLEIGRKRNADEDGEHIPSLPIAAE